MLDSRPRGRGFKPHCVVSLSKNINPSLGLVQPRKTRPFITERLLMERKELNQTNQKDNQSEADFLRSDSLKVLNSGIILKSFTHEVEDSAGLSQRIYEHASLRNNLSKCDRGSYTDGDELISEFHKFHMKCPQV